MIVYRDMTGHRVRWHDIRTHPEHNRPLHVMMCHVAVWFRGDDVKKKTWHDIELDSV